MKEKKELAARGCLCAEPNSPKSTATYIVTDPKGELLNHEEGIRANGQHYRDGTQKMSGMKQPVIARMENGNTTSNLSTVLKVLAPLGETLYIADLKQG